ncbi:MAG: hypothetical protein R3B41_03390 [Candidatus Doudnabacteria bacterium]
MIIPAILENDHEAIHPKLDLLVELKTPIAQIDFCDGDFVPHTTVDIIHLPNLPQEIEWEAHLMISNPANFELYRDKGFSKIIVHYEAFDSEAQMDQAVHAIKNLGMTPALAINPETAVSVLSYDTDTLKHFTILSVTPGKQGGEFIKETLYRIKELRELAPEAEIEVDGGINLDNIQKVIDSGANNFAVGSGIFAQLDPAQAYLELTKIKNQNA